MNAEHIHWHSFFNIGDANDNQSMVNLWPGSSRNCGWDQFQSGPGHGDYWIKHAWVLMWKRAKCGSAPGWVLLFWDRVTPPPASCRIQTLVSSNLCHLCSYSFLQKNWKWMLKKQQQQQKNKHKNIVQTNCLVRSDIWKTVFYLWSAAGSYFYRRVTLAVLTERRHQILMSLVCYRHLQGSLADFFS